MKAILITHTHWDREWYRTFQAFRARLVDAVDRVLDLCAADPGYRFVLDGQSIVLEDYAAVRPERERELRARVRGGAIAVGPWYVQPDSLLPSGEAHVRNLLEGRRVAREFGGGSQIAYTPDSFGHPAQFPHLLAGFGLRAFVYWRGNGAEIDALPAEYDWVAPDGTRILACHLARGYFAAGSDAREPLDAVVKRVAGVAADLGARTRAGVVALMNGIDHQLPESRTAELARALADATGVAVERGLLEDYVAAVEAAGAARPEHRGELLGARTAPLLPGVWSARSWIKLANRACEAELVGWAEPFAALAERLGARPERAALRLAWRELLPNQAHDSLCGCSRDEVHEQMRARFAASGELAFETTARCLEALSGLPERRLPWSDEFDLAVFNPSPFARSDVVRFAFDPHPFVVPGGEMFHPVLRRDPGDAAFEVDGVPARAVASDEPGRLVLSPDRAALDVEFVARDVPALGWKRVRLRRCAADHREQVAAVAAGGGDARIECEDRRLAVAADGCVDLDWGAQRFTGLLRLEDTGDRGDTYDFDRAGESDVELAEVSVERGLHPSGLARLRVVRRLRVPARLEPDRETRSRERAELRVATELRIAPGVARVDVDVRVDNTARDHRLRVLFPLGAAVAEIDAATTLGVARRRPGADPRAAGVHPASATFPLQGFARAGALAVAAWGIAEAELVREPDGAVLALTLLRCVGSLSRPDLRSRPGPAGPGIATPRAQCAGELRARLALFVDVAEREVRAAELGLRAVAAGAQPLFAPGRAALELEPAELVLSAFKPAEGRAGGVARVLNPTDREIGARLRVGVPFARAVPVRLDETELPGEVARRGDTLEFAVPPRALRSVWIA